MYIDYDYQSIQVPQEIVKYCDEYTFYTPRDDLRYIDCIYMNMGYYGNDPEQLTNNVMPVFE
jgi:hypothetical protein